MNQKALLIFFFFRKFDEDDETKNGMKKCALQMLMDKYV